MSKSSTSSASILVTITAVVAALFGTAGPVTAAPTALSLPSAVQPNFGPNVMVFDPSMPTSQIQATVDAIFAQQGDDEMGTNRYSLLFKPGTYGTVAAPLKFQVGYYTEVAGLGQNPTDVVINGSVDVYDRCRPVKGCFALDNFWRSLSNLTVNFVPRTPSEGCRDAGMFWAASQASPMRRVNITGGTLTLMDFCSAGPSYASGGFIADSKMGAVINGSQQQYMARSSSVGSWTNGVWNQVFAGVDGAPSECFPGASSCGGPYTTLVANPVSREKPYLFIDSAGKWKVFVPALRTNSSGTTWENGPTPGRAIPLSKFFIAKPSDSVATINSRLASGMNLLFTPGVYGINKTIQVKRADTVVLGLGMATLTAVHGAVVMSVADVPGVDVAGLMIDAGTKNSPVLLRIGQKGSNKSNPANPIALQDVFFRVGGPNVGKATVSLEVNSDNVILDDLWVWRADHGNAGTVGWTINTGKNGVIVNGDDVTATGFFVEHYQQHNVIWNGNRGKVIFFQNEMAYDPPSQAAWMQAPGVKGWSALKVAPSVTKFNGYGMGSYSFFNQGVDVFADNAYEVPATLAPGSLHNLLTIFLDPATGKGGINNVVNGVGGSSTIANPSVPVTVVDYPALPITKTQMDLPVTFDSATVDYGLIGFGGAEDSSVVVDPTDAGNKVAKVVRAAGAQTYAGTTITAPAELGFASRIPFTASDTSMSVRVWSPDAGIPVRLKVEEHADNSKSVETEATTTVAGGWETLNFNFANQASGTAALNLAYNYDKASIFFDFGRPIADAVIKTYFFDDVKFAAAPPPPPPAGLITFDEIPPPVLTGFGGAEDSTVAADPANAANKVAKVARAAGAQVYAGTTVSTQPNFEIGTIGFTAAKTKLTARVWSPDAGIPVRLKVENSTNGAQSVETEATTSVAGGWETLTFDFANQVPSTPALNLATTYNKASIFFDFGRLPADAILKSYYLDDLDANPVA